MSGVNSNQARQPVFVEIPAASHNDFPGLEELVEREIGRAFRSGQ